jgi:phage gp36-like protein
MSWIALTPDHVVQSLAETEASALRTLQLAAGATDPLPDVIAQTVAKVQGYVAVRYLVGQPGTVPEQLLATAIALARWALIGRLPIKALATDIRRAQYEDALAELRDVAAGKFKLSLPANPAADQPGAPAGGAWGSQEKV